MNEVALAGYRSLNLNFRNLHFINSLQKKDLSQRKVFFLILLLLNLQICDYIRGIYILWGYETSILGTCDNQNHRCDDIYDIGEEIHDDI